jgi:hypothetical protein
MSPTGTQVLMNAGGDLALRSPGAAPQFHRRRREGGALTAVAATTQGVVLVGEAGRAYRWQSGSGFSTLSTGATTSFRGACRASDSQVYVVGDGGAYITDGSTFLPLLGAGAAKLTSVTCRPGGVVAGSSP